MNPEARRKARLWLGMVLVLGMAIGVVFGYSFGHRSYAAATATPKGPTMSEPERRAKKVAEMTKEIGLTAEQSEKMDEIIQSIHEEMKAIHEKADADMDAARQRGRAKIREILTPEQKPKFEEMVRRIDEERKKHEQQGK